MNAKITPFERDQDEGWRDAHKGFTINNTRTHREEKQRRKKERTAFNEVENTLYVAELFLKDVRKAVDQWREEVKND